MLTDTGALRTIHTIMTMKKIDLRSDTKTLPTDAMRKAMYEAELGDDESGEDPTVNSLEELAARMLGKESALLTASGMMSNLLAVLASIERGDEIITGSLSHISEIEKGETVFAGAIIRPVRNEPDGTIELSRIEATIRARNSRGRNVSLLCLENTHNYCDGNVLTADYTAAAADIGHRHGLRVHIDGARIFNAAVALNVPVNELAGPADSVCFCLSKGLSCPVGSLLCGTKAFIAEARRWRKILGGQMRQAGVIAAAGIIGLTTMVDRLADDHANARKLALGLSRMPGIRIQPENVRTNIVFFEPPASVPAADFIRKLEDGGVRMYALARGETVMVRAVTSRMVTGDDIDEALSRIEHILT